MILERDIDAGIVATLADEILVPRRDTQTRTGLRSQRGHSLSLEGV